MSNLEKKVNLLVELALAKDEKSREAIKIALASDSESASAYVSGRDIREAVECLVQELSVPCGLKGHMCIVSAVCRSIENPELLSMVTHGLYNQVALDCGTTRSRAERVIRNAIEVAWDRIDSDVCLKYFGSTVSPDRGRPTNREFIAQVANHIKRKFGL